MRQTFGGFEFVAVINRADWLGSLVANIDRPNGDFVAVAVLVGLRAVKKHSAPLAGCAVGVGVAGGLFVLPTLGAHIFTLAGAVAVPVGIGIPAIAWRALGCGGVVHFLVGLRISHSDCGEIRNKAGDG